MAGLTLAKGNNLSLTKTDPGLQKALVGLGWDPRTTTGDAFDLDASALLGDNRSGEGEGDDEQILIDLTKVAADVERVVIVVSIDQADARGQNFGQVRGAYCRVVNQSSDAEVVRFDLSEDAAPETSMLFAEIYRNGAEWKFKAVGQGYASGLAGIATDFGVPLG